MPPQYVIQDPNTPYAIEMIRRMRSRFGWKAVCFYSSSRHVPTAPVWPPELSQDEFVAASYRVDSSGMSDFIDHLARHHDVRAVVPYNEVVLDHAITIAEQLRLPWVQPEIMRRFRDKHALKTHLRQQDPDLHLNFHTLVHSPSETLAVVRRESLARFVLKPNNGYGNVDIGIFDADVPRATLEAHWNRKAGSTWLLEGFISGPEFHCNGQVDAEGNITIIDIGQSLYRETTSRGLAKLRADQTPSDSPFFLSVSDYTRRIIAASGLRRSPFHAEVRIDEQGPCLVECAARLIGADYAFLTNIMHGPPFDIFDLAAAHYGAPAPTGNPSLNWREYDSKVLSKIRGVATRPERVRSLAGVSEVEAMPEFGMWMAKPFVGQSLNPTNSLFSSAYALAIQTSSSDDLDAIEAAVRRSIRWNLDTPNMLHRAQFGASTLLHSLLRRLPRHRSALAARMRVFA